MSKIVINVDTEKKTMAVKVDDKKVPAQHINLSSEDSPFGFGVQINTEAELGDMREFRTLVAALYKDEVTKSLNKFQEYLANNE